jgi:carbon-monoxide dehydrogenase small subunit
VSQPVSIEPPARQHAHAIFIVNGERHEVAFAPNKTLLEVLREDLAFTGTKHGCELGECGTCTVLADGVPILSCLALAVAYEGCAIETVEGMASNGTLHPLQEAFADLGAAQCGNCTPGFLLAAKALLDTTPNPSREEISEALSGNLCRCTGYLKIFEAVERVRDARLQATHEAPGPDGALRAEPNGERP